MPSPPLVVPPVLRQRAGAQEGLLSVRQCHDAGITDAQLHRLVRQGRWTRPARGVYDTGEPSALDLDAQDRRRRRAALLGPLAHPGSVATGVAALVLHGVQGAPPVVVPEVTFPDGGSRRATGPVRVRRLRLERSVDVFGVPCATVADALVQAASSDRLHAIAMMDSARHLRLITPAAFAQAAARARRLPGGPARAAWWAASDPRAESPAETWARLTCTDAGFRPDCLQLCVDDRTGRQVARVDLAWLLPGDGVLLVEIDGRDVHSLPDALLRDRVRQNRLVGRRTIVLRFTGREAWDGTAARRIGAVLLAEDWHRQVPPRGDRYRLPA